MEVLLLALAVGLGVGLFRHRSARLVAEQALRDAQVRLGGFESELAAAQRQVAALARFQAVVDVEAEVAQMRAAANDNWNAAQTQATNVRAQAQRSADQLMQQTAAERDAILANAAQAALEAAAHRDGIVAAAHVEAKRIAGEALDALGRKKELDKTLRALENTINGYGLEYLTPSFALLQELGDQYGFAQAGSELKAAIARAKAMVRQGTAARCDYVEPNRRATATAFVIDAFNGKVASTLAGVKHDNYGVLQQEIRDSFQLVNHLGEAFRNARIEPAYLEAQLLVLKWAVAAHEVKLRDKEEQRALRERIREEEKAKKEYARAVREAAKEEETVRRSVEKARADLEKSSDAQRAKYEEKLRELTERLQVAEEKGQRALSMAQQTKSGHVYVISNVGSFGEDVLKIGMTRRLEPLDRVKELGDASVPFEFDVHAMIRCEDAPALERQLQRTFLNAQVNKINPRKEFFRLPVSEVRAAVDELGIHVTWFMAAAAREWRESVALEAKLRLDPAARATWSQQQVSEQDRAALEDAETLEEEEGAT